MLARPIVLSRRRIIMAKITLKGNPVDTAGNLPAPGTNAPAFTLVKADL